MLFSFRRSSTAANPGSGSCSKESSPDISSGRSDSKTATISFSKRESSPGVTFKFGDDDDSASVGTQSTSQSALPATNTSLQKTPSRKSTDSSGGDAALELPGEKTFEMSLNNILNKCSETSLDKTSDSRDDPKKSDRKKKSTPWYSVSFVHMCIIDRMGMIFSQNVLQKKYLNS